MTINNLLLGISLASYLLHIRRTQQAVKALEITILKPAFLWGMAALGCWSIACAVSFSSLQVDDAWQDQAWYWSAVITCCPLISILGAKRPTTRVWTWFIVVPLLAVLGWPALTTLIRFPEIPPLEIQLPVFLGFILVLTMGSGNYLGTRFGLSVVVVAIAALFSLWPISSDFNGTPEEATQIRAISAFAVALAVQLGFRQASRPTAEESPFDKLWFDFRDAFGIVWSIRIQERINHTAEAENWSVHIGSEGFVWDPNCDPHERIRSEERLRHTLHWLLRRFVEPEWIEQRLVQ